MLSRVAPACLLLLGCSGDDQWASTYGGATPPARSTLELYEYAQPNYTRGFAWMVEPAPGSRHIVPDVERLELRGTVIGERRDTLLLHVTGLWINGVSGRLILNASVPEAHVVAGQFHAFSRRLWSDEDAALVQKLTRVLPWLAPALAEPEHPLIIALGERERSQALRLTVGGWTWPMRRLEP